MLAAHIYNSFSVTNLFTYVRNRHPGYGLPLRVLYWGLTIFGGLCICRYLHEAARGRLRASDKTSRFGQAVVGLSLVSIVALNSITSVEVRFNVIPIAILSVAAVCLLLARFAGSAALPRRYMILAGLAILLCTVGSYAMDRRAPAGMDGRSFAFDLVANRCFLVGAQSSAWNQAMSAYHAWMQRHHAPVPR